MAATPTSPIVNKRTKAGNVIDICLFGTMISTDKVSETFKPTEESAEWQSAGNCIDYQINPQTEDDQIDYFNRDTKAWTQDKNTAVTSNQITFTMAEMNQVVWQILYGVDKKMTVGTKVTPFVRNSAGVKCWLRMTKYDADKNKLLELEVCGELKAESTTENNKLMRPKLTLDVIQTSLNELSPEAGVGYPTA